MTQQKSRSFTRAGGFLQGGSDVVTTTQILPQDNIDAIGQLAELIEAPQDFLPKTSEQQLAFNLYQRGLNVIPLPRPAEVKLKALLEPGYKPGDKVPKPPFTLREFYTRRLHVCAYECRRNGCRLPEGARFYDLFYNANIGVMVGATSRNLIDIDCDTVEAYKRIGEELAKRGIYAWQYTSSGEISGNRGHYLLRVREGEVANTANNDGVEVYGNMHYAVLPPSTHPSGDVYCWVSADPMTLPPGELPQEVSIDALAFLGVRLKRAKKELELYGLPAFTAYLSDSNRRILATGIAGDLAEGERYHKLTKAAYDLFANASEGFINYIEAEQLLLEAAAGCNYPQHEVLAIWRSANNVNKRWGLTPAKRYHDNGKEHTTSNAWQVALAFAGSFDWREYKRSAQSARATFMACVMRSKIEGDMFRASVREVQELANFGNKSTAHRMLAVLSSDQPSPALLNMHKDVRGTSLSGASTYTFTERVLQPGSAQNMCVDGTVISPCTCTVPSTDILKHNITNTPITQPNGTPGFIAARQDVFYRLGKPALRVYEHLLLVGGERTLSAIAKRTGQYHTSVSRSIKRLMLHGLVTHSTAEQLYIAEAKTEHELEMLAAVLGTLGKQEARKRQHQDEREMQLNIAVFRARNKWREAVNRARAYQDNQPERA